MQLYGAQCYARKGERYVEYTQLIPEFNPSCVNTSLGVYAFQLFKKDQTTIDGKIIFGETTEHTGFFYPNGKIYTLEELMQEFPQDIAFCEYVEKRGWSHVIHTRVGVWRPYDQSKDQIIEVTHTEQGIEQEEELQGEVEEASKAEQNDEQQTTGIEEKMAKLNATANETHPNFWARLKVWWNNLFNMGNKQAITNNN